MADKTISDGKTVTLKPTEPTAKPKLAPVSTGPKPVVVSVPTAVPVAAVAPVTSSVPKAAVVDVAEDQIKKGPFLDKVVERSGVKRSDAKLVVEALFEVMSQHLIDEADMQLPPLGKLKVIKSKDVGKGAKAITLKLRTPNTEG